MSLDRFYSFVCRLWFSLFLYNNNFSVLFFSSARRTQAATSSSSTRKKQLSTEKKNVVLFCWLCSEGETRAGRKRDWNLIEEKEPEENRNRRKIRCVNRERAARLTAMMMMSHCLRPVRRSLAWSSLSPLLSGVLCANKNTHNFCALLRAGHSETHYHHRGPQHSTEENLYFYVSLFRTPTQQQR